MKTLKRLALSHLLVYSAFAQAQLCSYKDYFSVSSTTHPALLIASSSDNEDIHVQVLDTKNFILQGTTKCRSGHALIKVQTHAEKWCLLDIKDGPFNFYPRISASCNGLRYLNTIYEGQKTHAYTIYFE